MDVIRLRTSGEIEQVFWNSKTNKEECVCLCVKEGNRLDFLLNNCIYGLENNNDVKK